MHAGKHVFEPPDGEENCEALSRGDLKTTLMAIGRVCLLDGASRAVVQTWRERCIATPRDISINHSMCCSPLEDAVLLPVLQNIGPTSPPLFVILPLAGCAIRRSTLVCPVAR
jgi:hypothetical protein